MKIIINLFFTITMFCNIARAQTRLDLNLKKELDSIFKIDQTIREFIGNNMTATRKLEIEKELGRKIENINVAFEIMVKNDSLNLKRIESLIQKHGYAGKSLVGEPTNEAMWYVIQHSNKIEKYFPVIEAAGNANELRKTLVVMMCDRILVNKGKDQIYGTQGRFVNIKNKKTGIVEQFKYIQPIQNAEMINERRKQIGFETTVEENALRLGITYKKFTYKDLEKIFTENDIIN
jgi:hypothetical protein